MKKLHGQTDDRVATRIRISTDQYGSVRISTDIMISIIMIMMLIMIIIFNMYSFENLTINYSSSIYVYKYISTIYKDYDEVFNVTQ